MFTSDLASPNELCGVGQASCLPLENEGVGLVRWFSIGQRQGVQRSLLVVTVTRRRDGWGRGCQRPAE